MIDNILGSVLGGSASKVIDSIGRIIDDVHTSKEEKAALQLAVDKLRQRPQELQHELNKLQAEHRSAYVAGFRPTVGYVGAAALAFAFIVNPMAVWFGLEPVEVPIDAAFELVIAILGISGLRTIEKVKGAAR
jgi:hypothetical protein